MPWECWRPLPLSRPLWMPRGLLREHRGSWQPLTWHKELGIRYDMAAKGHALFAPRGKKGVSLYVPDAY